MAPPPPPRPAGVPRQEHDAVLRQVPIGALQCNAVAPMGVQAGVKFLSS